jgi:hypothetical protein
VVFRGVYDFGLRARHRFISHGLADRGCAPHGRGDHSLAVNPALTIMANALRVGDHLFERMK